MLPDSTWDRGREATGFVTLGCGTDNQGNSFLVDGLMTTKFPLGVILMELAHQLKKRQAVLRARWLPRLQNEEADSLTNGDFRHFDPRLRVHAELKDLNFEILDSFLAEGAEYHDQVTALREKEKRARAEAKEGQGSRTVGSRKRKRKGESLRDKDPW